MSFLNSILDEMASMGDGRFEQKTAELRKVLKNWKIQHFKTCD
jgi:hypothetical protein